MPMADMVSQSYEAHAGELQRFAQVRVRDADAAEDLVHEAFLRLSMEVDAGRVPGNPRAWLYRVISNLIVSQARRARTAARYADREPIRMVMEETPESRYLLAERSAILRVAMQGAGPQARLGLVMAAEGYSGQEIARALGRSHLATRTFLHRARAKARHALTTQGWELHGSPAAVDTGHGAAA
jgi:RNA polymerase sigma-70 factor (ECF subfamily)